MRTLPDDRWSCRGCAVCCHGFRLGPVSPETIADLQQRDVAARWPPAAAQPWFSRDEEGEAYLTHRDGACVFLQPDRRCFLHAAFGEAAKPGFCRIFPLRFTSSPAGLTATIRPACSQYHRSHRDGADIEDSIEGLDGVSVPVRRLRSVALLPDQPLPLADWPAAEAAMLDTIEQQDGSPEATVAALRPALGLPPQGDRARYQHAAAALLYVLDRALSDAEAHQHRAELAAMSARQGVPLPRLDADARRYVRLVVRSHLASADFQPLGSVAVGLGRVLLELLLARLACGTTAEISAAQLGPPLARWNRLIDNPSLLPLLRAASPALLDLTRHAPGQARDRAV